MELSNNLDIRVFDSVPKKFAEQVDLLLEDIGSNNRIVDESTLSDYSKEMFANKKDRFKYIVAFNGEEVIGIVIVFKREIEFHGKKIILGGLGGVGTKKEYRGRGIASEMLRKSDIVLKKAVCDVAYLGTDINDPLLLKLYAKFGFVLLNRAYSYLGKSGKKYFENDSLIAPINSQEIFNEVLADKKPFYIGESNW
ncbi:MAG TPA: GNAT family N-acetyltransferase [Candidatus Saccharimonadales bacterium]|nr:GNAT family N-acetyltransferase [Candidatus Saccharimonadales bacterium]